MQETRNLKKIERDERKKKKLLAEYELAKSNDAVKRPGQFLDAPENEVSKKPRVEAAEGNNLSAEELKALKKQLAERKKYLTTLPRFFLQYDGINATLSTSAEDRKPILTSDLQQLLTYALYGNSYIAPPQRWCVLQKPNRLTNIVTLVVEGITSIDFFDHEHCFSKLTEHFDHRVEFLAPSHYGSDIIRELAYTPLSTPLKDTISKKFGTSSTVGNSEDKLKALRAMFPFNKKETNIKSKDNIPSKLPESDSFPRTYLLLSMYQMLQENYPLPHQLGFIVNNEGFYKPTKEQYIEVSETSPMFSIDCEMCITTAKIHELTHIAIVNEKHEVVYETLVKPWNRITNYLTQYSGITASMLENVEVRLEDVQEKIREIIPSDGILVGHSLNSDLQAINVYHPYVIDTSVIFNLTGNRRHKSKLSLLTSHFLGEEIQTSHKGHSPVEDAIAAMKLVQLKLAKGYLFGDSLEVAQEEVSTEDQSDQVQPSEVQSRSSLFKHIEKASKTVAIVGSSETIEVYKALCSPELEEIGAASNFVMVPATNNKETIDRLKETAVMHNFSVAHIDVSKKLKKCVSKEKKEKIFKKLDSWFDSIFSHVSLNGMYFIVFGGPKSSLTENNNSSNSDLNNSNEINVSSNSSNSNTANSDIHNPGTAAMTTTTEVKEETSSNSTQNKTTQSEKEIKSESSLLRRHNGAVFIRVKTAK